MIAAIMLIFVAALTPGFRRSRLRRKGEARLQLEVGTGTAISNIAEWGGFNVTFIIATWSPSRPTLSMAIRQVMGVLHVLSRHRHGHIRARGRGYRAGQSGRGEECRSPGVAATMVMGVILGVLLGAWPGQSRGFWCGRMRSSGASRLRRPLRRCSGWRRRPPCLTVCRQQLPCAAGAGHGVAAERDPSQLVLRGDDPGLLLAGHSAGARCSGCWKGRLSASSWPGRRSSSCWNGKRRAPVWNAPFDPDRSPGDQNPDVFQSRCRFESKRFFRGS